MLRTVVMIARPGPIRPHTDIATLQIMNTWETAVGMLALGDDHGASLPIPTYVGDIAPSGYVTVSNDFIFSLPMAKPTI